MLCVENVKLSFKGVLYGREAALPPLPRSVALLPFEPYNVQHTMDLLIKSTKSRTRLLV